MQLRFAVACGSVLLSNAIELSRVPLATGGLTKKAAPCSDPTSSTNRRQVAERSDESRDRSGGWSAASSAGRSACQQGRALPLRWNDWSYAGRSKVQLLTKKVQLFACATAHQGKIGRSYMLKKGAARFARRAFFVGVGPSNLPLCAVAQAKSWTFLIESWTFDRPECVLHVRLRVTV